MSDILSSSDVTVWSKDYVMKFLELVDLWFPIVGNVVKLFSLSRELPVF